MDGLAFLRRAFAQEAVDSAEPGVRRLILVAGKPSHAPGVHEFRAGAHLLARCLASVPDLVVEVHVWAAFRT